MTSLATKPGADEAAPNYFTYIDKVPPGDIRETLARQKDETLEFLLGIPEDATRRRPEPGKWTLREVLAHVNDTERLFVFRAFWFARGFDSPLPSFEPDIAAAAGAGDDVTWARHVEEFTAVRSATIAFFRNLPEAAWNRTGIASGNPFTVRSFAWLAAGHLEHHLRIVRERYLA